MQSEYASTLLIGRLVQSGRSIAPTERNGHWQGACPPRKRLGRWCCACTLHWLVACLARMPRALAWSCHPAAGWVRLAWPVWM